MLSGIITALLMALFVIGCLWAWSPKRKHAFEDAARMPLQERNGAIDANTATAAHAGDDTTETPR